MNSRSGVGVEDGPHRLSSSARNGGLLDDDLGGSSNSGDLSSGELDVAERDGEERETAKKGSAWIEIRKEMGGLRPGRGARS